MKKAKQGAVPVPKKNLWKQIAKHWEFYVLLLPGAPVHALDGIL